MKNQWRCLTCGHLSKKTPTEGEICKVCDGDEWIRTKEIKTSDVSSMMGDIKRDNFFGQDISEFTDLAEFVKKIKETMKEIEEEFSSESDFELNMAFKVRVMKEWDSDTFHFRIYDNLKEELDELINRTDFEAALMNNEVWRTYFNYERGFREWIIPHIKEEEE